MLNQHSIGGNFTFITTLEDIFAAYVNDRKHFSLYWSLLDQLIYWR